MNMNLISLQVNVTINKNTDESYKVKELMRIKGAKEIRSQLEDYIKSLKVGKWDIFYCINAHNDLKKESST